MSTITDYQGRTLTGALREVPEQWTASCLSDGGFLFYKGGYGDVYAVIEFDHDAGGWVWRLHTWSLVEAAGNRYGKPCTTALQGVRAVQRAAKRHGVAEYF